MGSVDISTLAGISGDSEEEILQKGLSSYIDSEIREARLRIKELQDEYGVETAAALEENVESGEVDEHPAWEAVIEWENLNERIAQLKALQEPTGD